MTWFANGAQRWRVHSLYHDKEPIRWLERTFPFYKKDFWLSAKASLYLGDDNKLVGKDTVEEYWALRLTPKKKEKEKKKSGIQHLLCFKGRCAGILITAPLPFHHFHPGPSTFATQITEIPPKHPFWKKKKKNYLKIHNQRERAAMKSVKIQIIKEWGLCSGKWVSSIAGCAVFPRLITCRCRLLMKLLFPITAPN